MMDLPKIKADYHHKIDKIPDNIEKHKLVFGGRHAVLIRAPKQNILQFDGPDSNDLKAMNAYCHSLGKFLDLIVNSVYRREQAHRKFHQQFLNVRSTLLYNNITLVDWCVQKLINSKIKGHRMKVNGYEYDDLKQVGVDGFLRAIEKYHSAGGASFSTYAIPWIKQRIDRFMMSNQTAIRTPIHVGFANESFVDNMDDVAFLLKSEDDREQ